MPWAKEHKETTHRRIVERAAAAFRERGIGGIGVADLMKQAGLTHGGFYAHFRSKEDLVAEALDHAADETLAWLKNAADNAPSDRRLEAVIDAYLSSLHRNHPEHGCLIAALGNEVPRHGGAPQQVFARRLAMMLDFLAGYMPAATPELRRQQAEGALATMVGAILIARGLDATSGERFLDEAREFLLRRLRQEPRQERSSGAVSKVASPPRASKSR
jgi:TetR/AcrR family transcriptional regulator, transcriptional repressor for nem operon